MPRSMEPTRRFTALAFTSALLLGACTGGPAYSSGDGGTGATGSVETGPTPAETFTPGVGIYTYENAGLKVTVDIQGDSGTLEIDNGTEHDLDPPDLYVRDAVDGHQVELDVAQSAPVPAGDRATFYVSFDEVDIDRIGLLILLFGKDNFGAFVRTG